MKTTLLKKIRKFKTKGGMKPGNNFYVFLVCLFFASLFWLLNTLGNYYPTNVSFPLKYKHLPKNVALLSDKIENIDVEIEGEGYNLLNLYFNFNKDSIYIDFDNAKIKSDGEKRSYIFDAEDILTSVEKQLIDIGEVKKISPNNLAFNFEKVFQKKAAVKLNHEIKLAPQFRVKKINITPDSVVLSGSEDFIININELETELLKFDEDIKNNTEKVIEIINPRTEDVININPSIVTVNFEIERFTEKSIEIPIKIINKISETQAILTNTKTNVFLNVAFDDYDNIDLSKIKAKVVIDSNNTDGKVRVEVEGYPENVIVSKVSPSIVEYLLIEKK